jgi:acetate kinase
MKVLVSNIGSTSFKFRMFEIDHTDHEIASGGVDRIGGTGGVLKMRCGTQQHTQNRDFADHGMAIRFILDQLVSMKALSSASDLDAVAFKAVMAGDWAPVSLVTPELLARMEFFYPVAPAHNPPYVAAMRMFGKVLGDTPLVAAFEPGFHRTIPERRRYYAVPMEWADKCGVRKYGFHGASHRYISSRTAELMGAGKARRIISCHLGGSSSICAVLDGESVATSMGLSPQSGLPQSNRAGDFDPFALALLKEQAGLDTKAALEQLGGKSGLAALSQTSGDMRDIQQAAQDGSKAAKLTLELFVTAVRDYVGAYLAELGGADAIVFTGGIGENNPNLRADICRGMEFAGIVVDAAKNEQAKGEARFDAPASKTALWVMPTNEEIVVARQAAEFLRAQKKSK